MKMETELLGVTDYIVLASMLVISSLIGIYYRFTGGKQKTSNEYLLADQNMHILPVAFSLMASFMSAISLMGLTREIYMYGTQFLIINFSYLIATPIAAYIFLPVFFRLQSPSAYAYLEQRFGLSTRILASLAFTFQMALYMSIVLYAPAIAFEAVTGLSYIASILSVGLVCTFYSTIGGMKAVLINDVFQSLMMFGSIVAVIVAGYLNVGTIGQAFEIARQGDRLHLFEMSPDPTIRHTFWTQTIGGVFLYCSLYGVNQTQVQRLLTIKDLKRSQYSLWIQWPILTTLSFLTGLAGLYMYAYYAGCDPLTAKRIEKADQLLPLMVVDTMSQYPGLAGFFVAGIFSASLSTVSSAINSLAAVTLEDYIKPFRKTELTDGQAALGLKVLAVLYGLLSIAMTFLVDFLGPSVLQAALSVFGMVGGPLLGLFTLGMCLPFANSVGAISGLGSSLAVLIWMSFGQPRPPVANLPLSIEECPYNETINVFLLSNNSTTTTEETEYLYLYKISYAWYTMTGWIICMAVGAIVSVISNNFLQRKSSVDPDLFIDPLRTYKLKNIDRKLYESHK